MSSILFLGTAGTSIVASRQLRASGGVILQLEDIQFHLDPGPGALLKGKEYGINFLQTTAILVSCQQLSHCNDLNVVIEAMTHGGIDQHGLVLGSKSVLAPLDGTYPYLTKHHRQLVEKVIPLDQNHKVGIGLVEINTLSVSQADPTAAGFKFFCPRFTLSYTGHTTVTDQLLSELAGTDILIVSVPFPGNTASGLYLDTEKATTLVSMIKPRVAVLTHFGLEMLKADPLVEAREIQRLTGVPTIAAHDGLKIAPESYAHHKSPVKGY
ncbi:MAG: MBL fold metallo-hydrolase [Nanoarchaeota archaeon]